MTRHTFAEGINLLRQRAVITVVIAGALAVPICLAGTALSMARWIRPALGTTEDADRVVVLLHPRLDQVQIDTLVSDLGRRHPLWNAVVVQPGAVADRLVHWFPYLGGLFEPGEDALLPPLLEITLSDQKEAEELASSPGVLAVGPRSALRHRLLEAAGHGAWILVGITVVLMLGASLLVAVWIHLELFRQADEITIMRLVGATEADVRGPFVVAVALPGAVAAGLALAGTLGLARALSQLTVAIGLPSIAVESDIIAVEIALALALPVAAAALTLTRHALAEFEE